MLERVMQVISISLFRTLNNFKKKWGKLWTQSLVICLRVEPIDWKWEQRPKGKDWTKEDAENMVILLWILKKVINLPKIRWMNTCGYYNNLRLGFEAT
jgi:hypothetical protein